MRNFVVTAEWIKKLAANVVLFSAAGAILLAAQLQFANAEVLLSDDFSKWPNYNFTKDDYAPPDGLGNNGWDFANGGSSDTYGGVTHYCAEIKTPGRKGDSDRAFRVWRHGAFMLDYDGLLEKNGTGALFAYREIYIRWYMRIPTDMEVSASCGMNYLKLWRFRYGPAETGGTEIYINFNGNSFSGSTMQVYPCADPIAWHTLVKTSTIRDGQWHCHELHLKLNDAGQANGTIQYWLDGVQRMSETNRPWNAAAQDRFCYFGGLGLGNTGARSCADGGFQSDWRALEFDDYVLSTTYVGPEGSSISGAQGPGNMVISKNSINWNTSGGQGDLMVNIGQPGNFRAAVYDLSGQTLVEKPICAKATGLYRMNWKPESKGGLYLFVLQNGKQKITRRIAVME